MFPVNQKPRFAYEVLNLPDEELLRIDADGTNSCRLTDNKFYDADPKWSPDGKRIAFSSFPLYERAIYIMDANGDNLFKVTNDLNSNSPAWSPDGKRIAFTG